MLQADRPKRITDNYPLGEVAEFVALAALFNDQRVLVAVAAYLLFAALGLNLGVAPAAMSSGRVASLFWEPS